MPILKALTGDSEMNASIITGSLAYMKLALLLKAGGKITI
jgi:hypothetical protein